MRGGLMVCGTASDVGKSHVVTGLCRLLHRRGVKVAPFKAQNMALNSFVTPSGHEMGRAQGAQALAAGVEPEVAMNPVLLKPTGERTSQVVVMGRPLAHLTAAEYHRHKPRLLGTVLECLADLRSRFDVVVVEGAGNPAEINLLAHDIVNLRVAAKAGLPALLVGDIDRGGVFASLYGTVSLLPDVLRARVRGFVVNKFRGDPALLADGLADLERRCRVPTLGVLPYVQDLGLDAEDSLALSGPRPAPSTAASSAAADDGSGDDGLDVAVVLLPRISNFTDLDALAVEPGVGLRFVADAASLGDPDVVVVPGTKATVADLDWLRGRRLDRALERARRRGTVVLGVCGGYQMLGLRIVDEVESGRGPVEALGWLDVETTFGPAKVTRQRRGRALGREVSGYEIHHGVTTRLGGDGEGWAHLEDAYGEESEGAGAVTPGGVVGTNLHGLFEEDGFRAEFLTRVARCRGKAFVPAGVCFAAAREAQLDRLADLLEAHLDVEAVCDLIREAAP